MSYITIAKEAVEKRRLENDLLDPSPAECIEMAFRAVDAQDAYNRAKWLREIDEIIAAHPGDPSAAAAEIAAREIDDDGAWERIVEAKYCLAAAQGVAAARNYPDGLLTMIEMLMDSVYSWTGLTVKQIKEL